MSGLCGVVVLGWEPCRPAQPPAALLGELLGAVGRMNQQLCHRGPDGAAVRGAGWAALGHRRLSVTAGDDDRQPVSSRDGRVQLLCSGRIFNHRELGALLQARGHGPRTRGEAETVLHAYEEWGVEALQRLRGMFALAILDQRQGRQTLLLARDPAGEKPLYYHLGETGGETVLSFGSEAKALFALPWVRRQVDPAGLADYLRYRYVAAPRTAFQHICKLPAGTCLQVPLSATGQVPEPRPYWHLSYRKKLRAGRRLLRDIVEEFLEEAVQGRLAADGPLGVLLSGDLESALVAALMRRQLGAQPLLSFYAAGADGGDRLLARQVAAAIGTRHDEDAGIEGLRLLPRILWHLDEPLGDPAILSTWYAAELCSEHVRTVLTGAGGAEAFAGYERYRRSLLSDAVRAAPGEVRRVLLAGLSGLMAGSGLPGAALAAERLRRGGRDADTPLGLLFERSMSALSAQEVEGLLHKDLRPLAAPVLQGARLGALFESADADHYLDRFLYTDLRSYLSDGVLVGIDRLMMAHGVEARSPLADAGLLALAAALPVGLKRSPGGAGQEVLREIGRRLLPGTVLVATTGRRERGRGPALARFFAAHGPKVDRLLGRSSLVEAGVLEARALGEVLGRPAQEANDRRFLLFLLEIWHRIVVLEERDVPLPLAA